MIGVALVLIPPNTLSPPTDVLSPEIKLCRALIAVACNPAVVCPEEEAVTKSAEMLCADDTMALSAFDVAASRVVAALLLLL